MAYLPELHYCCACGAYLGADDGDAICAACEETFSEENVQTILQSLAARLRPLAQSYKTYPPELGGDPNAISLRLSPDELIAIDLLLARETEGPAVKKPDHDIMADAARLVVAYGMAAVVIVSFHPTPDGEMRVGVTRAEAADCPPGCARFQADVYEALDRILGDKKPADVTDRHATGFSAAGGVLFSETERGPHPGHTPPAKE